MFLFLDTTNSPKRSVPKFAAEWRCYYVRSSHMGPVLSKNVFLRSVKKKSSEVSHNSGRYILCGKNEEKNSDSFIAYFFVWAPGREHVKQTLCENVKTTLPAERRT